MTAKCSGAKVGMPAKRTACPGSHTVSPMARVPGEGLVDDVALLGHHLLGLGQAHGLPGLEVEILFPALEAPGADAQEGDAVTVRLVHVGLDLEDEGGEVVVQRIDRAALGVSSRQRGRGQLQEALQKLLHAEVVQRRAEEDRAELPAVDGCEVEVRARALHQLHLLPELGGQARRHELIKRLRVVDGTDDALQALCSAVIIGIGQNAAAFPVIDALEGRAAADGPVHRIGVDPELGFQLVDELKGIAGLVVQLVDKGKDRDAAHGADPEELPGLRLDALGRVDHHHGAVRRHQRPVGIL